MKKRFSCFAVAVMLLTLTTLWATACGSTSAEAGTADPPVTTSPSILLPLKMEHTQPGDIRSIPSPWMTSVSCYLTSYLLSVIISCSVSLGQMAALSWCPPLWWKSSITERRCERESCFTECPA